MNLPPTPPTSNQKWLQAYNKLYSVHRSVNTINFHLREAQREYQKHQGIADSARVERDRDLKEAQRLIDELMMIEARADSELLKLTQALQKKLDYHRDTGL